MGTRARRLKTARRIKQQQTAQLKALSTGDIHIEDVLRTPSDALKRVSIHVLLMRTPSIGEKGSEKICKAAKVWPTHRLGNLSKKERDDLIAALPVRAKQ